jgi:hypothetical protein
VGRRLGGSEKVGVCTRKERGSEREMMTPISKCGAGRSIHTTGELRAKAMAAGRAARLRDLSMVYEERRGERMKEER